MDDAAYCAYGCPDDKLCPVANPDIGCAFGTELLHNPGRPRCCEVDNDYRFLDTVRAILSYGNSPGVAQRNAGTGAFRQALGQFLNSINFGGSPGTTFIWHGLLDLNAGGLLEPSMIDDLVQLMHTMVPDSGFKVKMDFADIVRQPVALKEDPRNFFISQEVPLQELPTNALTVAAHLIVRGRDATGAKAISLVLNALANFNPWMNTDTELRLDSCDPKISPRQVAHLRAAIQSTRIVGKVAITIWSNPFASSVQLGQFEVASGKEMILSENGVEITIT